MLRTLRWKLALLYFGSALGIIILLAAGTYFMLERFFIQQVDLALQYKMAGQFKQYGLSLPIELQSAERLWMVENPHPNPTGSPDGLSPSTTATLQPSSTPTRQYEIIADTGEQESESDEDEEEIHPDNESMGQETDSVEETPHVEDDIYDGRLSSIFIVPVSTPQGSPVGTQQAFSPISEDFDASVRALSLGYDLRTVLLPDGTHARLLTYRTTGGGIPPVIQIGRLLDDQERLLQMYLLGLLILGIIASLAITVLSWILSGRSIKPAQEAWDQQQLFIANASHELRTPLTLIRATTDYAVRAKKAGVQEKSMKDVLGEVDYMNHLVDDLLLLSRLDTHKLQMDHEEIDIDTLLREMSQQAGLIAKGRGINVKNLKSECQIVGDPVRIRQVLLILLDNAIRFTPLNGTIELGAIQNARWVDIYVKDNGSGIAPEYLTHIFDRFFQVPDTELSGSRNNGLGLSIAKALVEAQEGRIRIESRPGQGTTIWLSMPSG